MRYLVGSVLVLAVVASAVAANYQPAEELVAGVALDWDDNVEDDLAYYNVYRAQGTDMAPEVGEFSLVTSATVSGYVDRGLASESEWWYYVTAVDDVGNQSEPSGVVKGRAADVIAPGAPGGLRLGIWTGRITIVVE